MSSPRYTFFPTDEAPQTIDLLIAACGYESRASYVTQQYASLANRIVAYAYPKNRVLAFKRNLDYFTEVGEVRDAASAEEFAEVLEADLAGLSADTAVPPTVAIDISSFDRERLSIVMRTIDRLEIDALEVRFIYAFADFDSHEAGSPDTILTNRPLQGFEGWTSNPSLPVACVVGLGFENLIALAALETLEPARTIAFIAESDDSRFQARVRTDNAPLLDSSGDAVLSYSLDDPFRALHSLEGVVHALHEQFRVVIVPLGPKVFALLSMIVALDYRDRISVWRVSSEQSGKVEDRIPTGKLTSLKMLTRRDT